MQANMEPWNARAVSDHALPGALAALFGSEEGSSMVLLGRSDAVRSQCCAQFAVARDRIWHHSKEEYIALRQWLLDEDSHAAPRDDRVAGRILSYIWHILFIPQRQDEGQSPGGVDLEWLNAQACPSAAECYCRLYGRCDLKGCTADRCYGQYRLPPNLKIPGDWALTHS